MAVHIGILPNDIIHTLLEDGESSSGSRNASTIRLLHPRTGLPSLFLPHQVAGQSTISEFQAIEPVNPRSWFVGDEVISNGKLLMIMPVDPAFLLIPILRCLTPKDGSLGQFRTADDILEEAGSKFEQTSGQVDGAISAKDVATFASLDCCTNALPRVCDVQEITPDITVYRYSPTKCIDYLRLKVNALRKPEVIESSRTLVRNLAKDGLMEDGNEKLLEAGRIKAACDLVSQYLPADLRTTLIASYDFSELDVYMRKLEDENVLQEQASTSSKSRKKADAKEATEQKGKRKAPKASQGVEKLKKANINGMSKLSTFFTKKA